jgi:hypothetical protein
MGGVHTGYTQPWGYKNYNKGENCQLHAKTDYVFGNDMGTGMEFGRGLKSHRLEDDTIEMFP